MVSKELYETAKERLLKDETIHVENRELFKRFFEFEEYKLKRQNQLSELDRGCYRTIYSYIHRFRNTNKWFGNKPWIALSREDIKGVYDAIEDGLIRNHRGMPLQDRRSYYTKIFKSKPFRLAGKAEVAREVIEFSRSQNTEVRFVTEDSFSAIVGAVSQPAQRLLLWLAWDVGENVGSLLELSKNDFSRQKNVDSNEPEYLIHLPREKLKRSRLVRTEPTLYSETVRLLDAVFSNLGPNERLFSFGHRQALKFLRIAARKAQATSAPNAGPVRWKDLRSGMACYLLKSGWTRDEVNARLGHRPNSSSLDRYINYLAIDRVRPKQKLEQSSLDSVRAELLGLKQRSILTAERLRRREADYQVLRNELLRAKDDIALIRRQLDSVLQMRSGLADQLKI